MRISDWSSDVCSSDLPHRAPDFFDQGQRRVRLYGGEAAYPQPVGRKEGKPQRQIAPVPGRYIRHDSTPRASACRRVRLGGAAIRSPAPHRSEEHTSELQSLMRISYAVFCLKKKKNKNNICHMQNNTVHEYNTIRETTHTY